MKKKKSIFILTLLGLSVILIIFALYSGGTSNVTSIEAPSEIPAGPSFVVPENPLGTLGLVGGLIAAVIVFVIAKKR